MWQLGSVYARQENNRTWGKVTPDSLWVDVSECEEELVCGRDNAWTHMNCLKSKTEKGTDAEQIFQSKYN